MRIPENLLSNVYIARCAFDYKGTCSSPEGQVSDFNIWKRELTAQEMIDFTSCNKMLKGDLVNWDETEWELVNMTSRDAPDAEVCISPRPGHVLYPELRLLHDFIKFCPRFNGHLSVIRDAETQRDMTAKAFAIKACQVRDGASTRYWNGWWDVHEEGVWIDVNNGSKLTDSNFAPWAPGQPNGDSVESCGMVFGARDSWNDVRCDITEYCGFCELDQAPDLNIRGLCKGSKFDHQYSWTWSFVNDRHSFRGYTNTRLYWNVDIKKWQLDLYSTDEIYATSDTF